MKYEDFEKFVREKCMYDTIYDDSDGRQILIIQMLDAYGMVDKALRARLSKLAGTERNNPDELTRSVINLLDYNLYTLSTADGFGNLSNLRNCLSNCSQSAWNVSDAISARYFNLIHSNEYSIQM